ncbi:MAG: hypothetical protein SGCHY_004846 [Lobulomycetales sp.]
MLAQLRNFLLYSTLDPEVSGVLWIDADVVGIPENLLSEIVDSGKDIATAICVTPDGKEYDRNTWVGPRKKPTPGQLEEIRRSQHERASVSFIPDRTGDTRYLSDMSNRHGPKFVPVDSVGGTFLYIKAQAHRSGIDFPTLMLIGIHDWDMKEGWDGMETEGICYTAKRLGYQCWGMPQDIVVHGF